uniref:TFIIB domain-containing protein n=1 Tax=Panagrellus redivivus TaxID=6233 RepID=A0A7E4V4V7_PANRE
MDPAHYALQTILNLFDHPQNVRNRVLLCFERVLEIKPSNEDYNALAAACVFHVHNGLQMQTSCEEIERITRVPFSKIQTNHLLITEALAAWRHQDFIKQICAPLNVSPTVQATAIETYMKAVNCEVNTRKFIRYSDRDAIAAAIVYRACQFSDSPKTMLEIGETVSVSEGDMLQAYEKLLLLPNYM